MKTRLVLALSLGSIAALPASAQFAGSDFFTNNIINNSLWAGPNTIAGSATFTQTPKLSYLSGGTASEVATLVWKQTNAPNIDWQSGLGVWLPQSIPLPTDGQHIEIGLMVRPTNSPFTGSPNIADNFFSFTLDTYNPTGGTGSADQVWDVYTSSQTNKIAGTQTAFPYSQSGTLLGLTYSSATHTIYAGYSMDTGASFTPVSSFDTSVWSSMDTFIIGILASSSGFQVQAVNNIQAIGFQVGPSAIPEPSTYAGLLGATVMLFAILRRRRTT
jgi:hypothetical protein